MNIHSVTHINGYMLFYLSLVSALLFGSCNKEESSIPQPLGDVTDRVVELGNPLKTETRKYADGTQWVYARNVWDMHAYLGKIYFGGGNSSNAAPASNAGPADLWSFNPGTGEFTKEYTVNEEQIHLIREFDGELYIPGHDSRESWSLGNFYRLESGVWKKYRTIPKGIHVYDIYKFKDRLYAALGPDAGVSSIQVSEDNGETWADANKGGMGRIYTLITVGGGLYSNSGYYFCSGEERDFTRIQAQDSPLFLPEINGGRTNRIERGVVFLGTTVYIVGLTYNDHQYLPLALARTRSATDKSRLDLPEGALPRDILVKNGKLLVLISTPADGGFKNAVLATKNVDATPVEWTELFHFTAPAFARSFEYLGGVFYFGLGDERETMNANTLLSPATGNILSVEYKGL